MTRRLPFLLLLPVLALGACSEVEDAVSDAASDAGSRVGCELAQPAVDEGRNLVDDITARIGADPESVQRELSAAGDALGIAEQGLSGETRDLIARAEVAVEDLRAQAQAVADGATVDDQVVEAAQAEYDSAAEELTGIC